MSTVLAGSGLAGRLDRLRGPAWVLAGLAASAAVGFGLARAPWLAAGAVLGAALLVVTMLRPLPVLALMLVIGPIDLSFLTGGFKGLLEEQGGLDMNGIRLIGIVVALGGVALVDPEVLRHAGARYGRWFVAFLLYATASLAITPAPVDGLRLLLKLAYPVLLFVAILGVVKSRADIERLATWVLAGAAGVTLLLAPILVVLGQYRVEMGRIRIPAIGNHENPMSFYLLMMILMAYARFSSRGQWRYLLLCVACGAWIAAGMTRITVLAMLAGLAGAALFSVIVTRNYRAVLGAVLVGAAVAVALMPTALQRTFGYVPSFQELVSLAQSPGALFRSMNWQGRQILWPVVLRSFLENPLTGQGLGSSTATLLRNFPPEWGTVVHNEYLRLLADTGLIGVTLFGLGFAGWGRAVVRVARRADPLVRELALPAFAGLVAWAIIAITDNAFDYYAQFTQYVGMLCAGAVAAGALAAPPAATEAPLPAPVAAAADG